MTGREDHAIVSGHGRGRAGADQARPILLALALVAAGCSAGQGPEALGPLFSRVTGPAFEGREAPPGTDRPFPNLGTIPPRPVLADPAVRDALTAALAEERQRSRNPLDPEMRPEPVRPAGTPGDRSMAMRPPGPPAIPPAPRVAWDQAPLTRAAPADAPATPARPAPAGAAQPASALPEMSPVPPPPPPAELLAPRGR